MARTTRGSALCPTCATLCIGAGRPDSARSATEPRLRLAREASARHGACAAPTRRGLPTSAIRWRRASGAGGVNRRSDRQRRSARAFPSVAMRSSASISADACSVAIAIAGSSWELAIPPAKSTCPVTAFVTTPAGRSRQHPEFAEPSTPSRHDHVLRRHGPYSRVAATSITGLSFGQAERASHRCRHTRCPNSSRASVIPA